MRTRFLKFGLVLILSLTFATPLVYAASVPGIARLEVQLPSELQSQQPTGFWPGLRALLGIRAPVTLHPAPGTTFRVIASAYASSPYQTDATPCVTAVGTKVRPGVVATNFLPIGALLNISGYRFIVEDRMHSRYAGYFMDIWFPSTSQAFKFGRRELLVTILGYGEPGQTLAPSPTPEVKKTVAEQPAKSFLEKISDWLTARVAFNPNRFDAHCQIEPDYVPNRFKQLINA